MAQQQEIQVPQFQAPPSLSHFRSPLGAPVRFLSLSSFSSFILMFFTRCRFDIHRCPVTHSRTSLTARREVVVLTPTTKRRRQCGLMSSCDINFVLHCYYNCLDFDINVCDALLFVLEAVSFLIFF
jgi:hypothetical protein